MVRGGSKGKQKETISDLSRQRMQDITAYFAELEGSNDRASALISAAAIDSELAELISRSLKRDLTDSQKIELFYGPKAPFGSFSSRILTAWALGLINDETRAQADTIRKIRNTFAHTVSYITFDNELIAKECDSLIGSDFDKLLLSSPRNIYIVRAQRIVMLILKELIIINDRKIELSESTPLTSSLFSNASLASLPLTEKSE